ncbi:hypothetical protein [Flammeovirga sp. SJP92]|uniref:hypothetical protein n=1 Tax=Flammeovirga sp. SJP92 TaxID=1775430 RepID=UPI0012F8AC05|nr:hypothetical protein [Flammeovirga sp. SJP92]
MSKILNILLVLLFFIHVDCWSVDRNEAPPVKSESVHRASKFQRFRDFDVEIPSVPIKKEKIDVKRLEDAPEMVDGVPVSEKIGEIRGALNKIRENKLFVSLLSEEDLISLPVGISKNVGGTSFEIVIYKVKLTPEGTKIDVGMGVAFPNSSDTLMFGAFDIPFSQERGIGGQGKLALLKDYPVKLSKDITLDFKGVNNGGQTYVNFGCDGYQGMGVEFDVVFNRELIRPATEEGDVIPNGQIRAKVATQIESWDDLYLEVNLPMFRMGEKNDRGFVFKAENVVYDQSEITNGSVVFPEGYESTDFIEGNQNLWKGFYIKSAVVMMPSDFDKVRKEQAENDKNSTTEKTEEQQKADDKALAGANKNRTSFRVNGLIIDKNGLTGNFQAHYLLSLEKGQLGAGWALSLEKIEVDILMGQFQKADLVGQFQIPTSDTVGVLSYQAQVQMSGDFLFSAATTDSLKFKPFGENSTLLLTRTDITIQIEDGEFYAGVDLDGAMNVATKDAKLELVDIDFQGLMIQTETPYVSATAFGLSSDLLTQKVFGREISIDEIGMNTKGTELRLDLDVGLSLHEGSEGFGGEAGLKIIGDNGNGSWKYVRTDITKVTIEARKENVYDIKGTIEILKDDPIYGDVFKGILEAKLGPMSGGGVAVEASVIFGKKEGKGYWYVDALAVLDAGIPVGPLTFHGFGGGIYYGMTKVGYSKADASLRNATPSATGGVYVPDKNAGFGFKAIIIMAIVRKETAFVEAQFEMNFYKTGGVQKAMFIGCANLMTPPKIGGLDMAKLQKMAEVMDDANSATGGKEGDATATPEPPDHGEVDSQCAYINASDAPIFAGIVVSLDFQNQVYHGELNVSIQAGVLEGGGRAIAHFEPDSWYIHIGTNKNPIYLKLLGAVEATSYFMLGDNLPSGFEAPDEVKEILGLTPEPESGGRNESALSGGRGVAFGASLKIDTGEKTFLIFYADIKAGFGFDLMLANYGANAVCANTGRQIGIKGWYAQGQVYAYVKAAIGVKVDLWFVKGKFAILDLGVAALLQFKGPNPMYCYGAVGGYYNILGGAVKGQCSFEFTIGEECKIEGASPLAGVEVVASITPQSKSENVDVFAAPQFVFNVPLNDEMVLMDPNTNEKKRYRIRVDNVFLKGSHGEETFDEEWNEDNTTLVLRPHSMLEQRTKYELGIKLTFQEKSNNDWVKVRYSEDLSKTVQFISGDRPQFIDMDKVVYSYPIDKQMNFFPQESNQGYIKLNIKGWDYLFEVENPDKWDVKARFTNYQGQPVYGDVSYNDNNTTVSLDIPSDMTLNNMYTFELVHLPKTALNLDANVSESTASQNLQEGSDGGSTLELTTRKATETIENNDEKVIYSSNIRTSYFKTFVAKMEGMNIGQSWTGRYKPSFRRYIYLNIPNYKGETFDQYEFYGKENIEQLIHAEADFEDTFYKQRINPLIYDTYPYHLEANIEWRNSSDSYGWVKPKNSLYFRFANNNEAVSSSFIPPILSEEEINSGSLLNYDNYEMIYFTDRSISKDYLDIQTNLFNLYHDQSLDNLSEKNLNKVINILESPGAPYITFGPYTVILYYTLPGKTKPNSSYNLIINNTID